MTPEGIGVLRRSAALAFALPHVGLRLRSGSRTLLHVDRRVHPSVPEPVAHMTPCTFRMAVAHAQHELDNGRTVVLLDLPADTDPAVDLSTGPAARLLAGPLVQCFANGRVVTAFAALIGHDDMAALVQHRGIDVALDPIASICLHHDDALDVTVVAVEQPANGPAALDSTAEALFDLFVAAATDELLARLC